MFLAALCNTSNEKATEVYTSFNDFTDEMRTVIDFHIETANYDDIDTLWPIPPQMMQDVADHIDESIPDMPLAFRLIMWWELILNLREYGGKQMQEKIILHKLKKDNGTTKEPPPDASGN